MDNEIVVNISDVIKKTEMNVADIFTAKDADIEINGKIYKINEVKAPSLDRVIISLTIQ